MESTTDTLNKKEMDIKKFYLDKADILYANEIFREKLLGFQGHLHIEKTSKDRELFDRILTQYLEEANLTISLVSRHGITKDARLLEVGSGLGFVYGFLKSRGYQITAIEPAGEGFEGCYEAATEMLNTLHIQSEDFFPLSVFDVEQLYRKFDIIFSNNVLEHIIGLEKTLSELKDVLKEDGTMIHNTVNYYVPYEPHFRIPLIPFFPQHTSKLRPSLRKYPLWNGLNFVTTGMVRRACGNLGLMVEFDREALTRTLRRLEEDEEFAERQKVFYYLYMALKKTGIISLLKYIPVSCTTPITFTIYKDTNHSYEKN